MTFKFCTVEKARELMISKYFFCNKDDNNSECCFFDNEEKKFKYGIVIRFCVTANIYNVYEVDTETGEGSWLKSKHHYLDKMEVYLRTKENYDMLRCQENLWKEIGEK